MANTQSERDRFARGAHDLIGVHTLRIHGWRGGRYRVEDSDNPWVRLISPARYNPEYWTFAVARDGVLECHTNLLGSPSLLGTTGKVLVIEVPPNRQRDLKIELV